MDKKQIAAILKEMAVLMEIRGDNPFKTRAHENAARILESLSISIEDAVASGEISNIKGIGKGTVEKIGILLETGSLPEYEELKASIPAGLLEVSRIQGLGPKKVKLLWDELDITSVDQLEAAARANRLSEIKGFGGKTQEKILANIELLRKFSGRHLLSAAQGEAHRVVELIRTFPGVLRCEIAGSVRRCNETVGDIDLVASAADGQHGDTMARFTGMDGVQQVTASGESKSTVLLDSGISVDLRVVAEAQFPFVLQHFTGSAEHNVALRRHAQEKDLKLNEYGLFRGEAAVECADEAAIYRALGMGPIPAELRENGGEIEAAMNGDLPRLIEAADIRGIIHTHSTWSDGAHSIEEMARGCQERGYQYLVVSDHSRAAAYANGLSVARIRQQQEEIDALNGRLNGFRVLKSIECDILSDGRLDYDDDVLATFDLVIVSIHSKFNMSEAEATQRIISAMENPYTTILGHMTGRLLLKREGYPVNHRAVIDAAADLGVSIEINANPRRLDIDWRHCRYATEKGVMICINPDAHRIEGIEDMQYGIGIARKGWLQKEQVLNTCSAEEVVAFAARRRA